MLFSSNLEEFLTKSRRCFHLLLLIPLLIHYNYCHGYSISPTCIKIVILLGRWHFIAIMIFFKQSLLIHSNFVKARQLQLNYTSTSTILIFFLWNSSRVRNKGRKRRKENSSRERKKGVIYMYIQRGERVNRSRRKREIRERDKEQLRRRQHKLVESGSVLLTTRPIC